MDQALNMRMRADFPSGSTRRAGAEAEEAACEFLEKTGIRVIERNFRARGGEIDIVGRQGDVLVFVEVRCRMEEEFGCPEESVGFPKRRKIVAAAREYIGGIPTSSWREARFDVIALVGAGPGAVIRHYPSAFDAKGKIL
jgi:putative endonuclease